MRISQILFLVSFLLLAIPLFEQSLAYHAGESGAQELIPSLLEAELKDEANKIQGKAILLIYSDTDWSGSILDSSVDSYSRDGHGFAKIPFRCETSDGIYSLSFQKQTEHGYLYVAVIQDGKLLDSTTTTAQFGVVSLAGNCKPAAFGGGCLIATAAFGSELAPQVQQLRETRDNILLQTQSGAAFMVAFNQFYYSFSPTIADWERENPIFKETVKIVITPLISTLSILNYVDIDSEVEMVGYGISVILLNIGIYFGVPVYVIRQIRARINQSQRG